MKNTYMILAGLMLLIIGGGLVFYFLKKKELESAYKNRDKLSAAANFADAAQGLYLQFTGKKAM